MKKITVLFVLLAAIGRLSAQYPPIYEDDLISRATGDPMKRVFITPKRVVWKSGDSQVSNEQVLLGKGAGQPYFGNRKVMHLVNKDNEQAGILLDFGREIHGGIQVTTSQSNNKMPRVRIRFGESVSEANGESFNVHRGKDGSTNHHALRDFEQILPGFGTIAIGNTGFRFVRIDFLDADAQLAIQEIRAIAIYRDIPYLGSFRSNDELLNKIWEVGAYTVHLNMLEYLVDGIKRDRMVWSGDIHPQMMTISHVFGYQDIIPKTLDFLKDSAPLPKFMNGIPSYSLWWIIMQHDWYRYQGKMNYLQEQKDYLFDLLEMLTQYIDSSGVEQLHNAGMRFIDWPTHSNAQAVHAGLQAMMVLAFDDGAELCKLLGESDKAATYKKLADKMRGFVPDVNASKQAASLQSIAGMVDATTINTDVIAVGGAKGFGAFFGYYMLQAQARAGDYTRALQNIRDFWGGMLDLGATTFWEEFDLEEAEGAARIDEIVPMGKKDYHRSTGIECYTGLRRSLCHGWASGPTPWLSEHVLGVSVMEPGGKKIKIDPHLGDLQWVEGTFPTAYGLLYLKHTRQANGKVKTEVRAPKGVVIIKN